MNLSSGAANVYLNVPGIKTPVKLEISVKVHTPEHNHLWDFGPLDPEAVTKLFNPPKKEIYCKKPQNTVDEGVYYIIESTKRLDVNASNIKYIRYYINEYTKYEARYYDDGLGGKLIIMDEDGNIMFARIHHTLLFTDEGLKVDDNG